MIYIFLGEDSAQSRKLFTECVQKKQKEGYEVVELTNEVLTQEHKTLLNTQSLFFDRKIYVGISLLTKKETRVLLKEFENTPFDLILWDATYTAREAKYVFQTSTIKDCKLPDTVFSFLDGLNPKNNKKSLETLSRLKENVDEYMIFFMISKRIRELILIHEGIPIPKLQSWQESRLKTQAGLWENELLVKFYESLFRIDVLAKTSGTYYSLSESMQMLLAYYSL